MPAVDILKFSTLFARVHERCACEASLVALACPARADPENELGGANSGGMGDEVPRS